MVVLHVLCSRAWSRFARFAGDVSGNLTIFGVIGFGMLMVVIGLVIDVGRVMNVHSQTASYADRVALAAAAELDGRNGALNRAIAAAQGANAQVDPGLRFSLSGDSVVGVNRLTFLSRLGPDPVDPFTRSPVAGDVVTATWEPGGPISLVSSPSIAAATRDTDFVLVDTTLEREDYLFFPLLGVLSQELDTSATVASQAVAGFSREICNAPPLMICNVNEAVAGPGASFTPIPGQMIAAKMQGGAGASWAPGTFGLLDTPFGTGANALREYVARVTPNTYCVGDRVDVKPGQNTGPFQQGMNTRFDMYDGPMRWRRHHPNYAPAANVMKGLRTQGWNCNNPKSNTSTPFPRDNCFMPSGTWPDGVSFGAGTGCTTYGGVGRAGDGNWDRANYWATNHSGDPLPPGYASMSRYEVYRYELENSPPGLGSTPQEIGAPTCSTATPISLPGRDRRVLQVAVVNCLEHQALLGGNARDVPVENYAEVFLTEPAGNTDWWGASNGDLFVEMIGIVSPNTSDSVLREYPVLYR